MKNIFLVVITIAFIIVAFNHFQMNSKKSVQSMTLASKDESRFFNWQKLVEPGKLNRAHAFLDNNCMACHNRLKGVERSSCVVCHANNLDILQRQPTSFHSDITTCMGCHTEHLGRFSNITKMEHSLIVDIGMNMLSKSKTKSLNDEKIIVYSYLKDFIDRQKIEGNLFVQAQVSKKEALLNCWSCHENDDRHFQLFGNDCVQCHRVDQWNISSFRHPRESSRDCVQCHQAPPSHYVKHFKMMSARIAKQPHAVVSECFKCHQSTHWTDIKKVGKFKHH